MYVCIYKCCVAAAFDNVRFLNIIYSDGVNFCPPPVFHPLFTGDQGCMRVVGWEVEEGGDTAWLDPGENNLATMTIMIAEGIYCIIHCSTGSSL